MERSRALEGEDESALIVHLGRAIWIGSCACRASIGRNSTEGERVERLVETAVDKQAGFVAVTLQRQTHALAFGHRIIELIEASFTHKGEFSAFGRSEIEGGIGGGEESVALVDGGGFEVEGDGVVVADFRAYPVEGGGGEEGGVGIVGRGARAFAEGATEFVHTGGFAQEAALSLKVGIREGSPLGRPALGGEGLKGGHDAVVDVLDGDAVAHVVVPHGKHSAEERGVAFFKLHRTDGGRRPVVVEPLCVEIVVVVAGGGHDVDLSIGNTHQFVAQFLHFQRVGITIIPNLHLHVIDLDRCFSLSMG